MQRCGIIILAAGRSSRLGKPKQLIAAEGCPLLARIARTALQSEMGPVVVVLGALAVDCGAVLAGLPVRLIKNPDWREGISSSLRVGIDTLRHEVDGIVILLCDQPMVTPGLIHDLIATGSPIAASSYGETTGPPAYFASRYFDELMALNGDRGGKELLRTYAGQVVTVDFAGGEFDIDTPHDYKRFVTSTARMSRELVEP